MRNSLLTSALIGIIFGVSAHAAETSTLQVGGDLMIHPNQISEYFTNASARIQASSTWNWSEMAYTKPYKTMWSQVVAKGPFQVKFTTDKLSGSEVTVDMSWNDPLINVGHFQINDQMIRHVGGARLVVNLQGTCSGMVVKVPAGAWKARGRLAWTWNGSTPVFAWREFQFQLNSAAKPDVNMGQCSGPAGLHAAIKESVLTHVSDQAWFQEIVKQAALEWVGDSMTNLRDEILKPRVVTMRQGLTFTWEPTTIQAMQNGLLRVPGQLVFRKDFFKTYKTSLANTNTDAALQAVTESGFHFPQETVQKATDFLYNVGELQTRILSNTIPAFVDLMNSRTNQFYVWPDLQKFATTAVFYFDLMAETIPSFSAPKAASGGGFTYNIDTNLLMYQWAPVNNSYVPYMDFKSNTTGTVKVSVTNQVLNVLYTPSKLPITYKFRPEIRVIRAVDQTFDAATFSTKGIEYLKSTPFSATLPNWPINEGLSLGVKDAQMVNQTLRVPLQLFKPAQK